MKKYLSVAILALFGLSTFSSLEAATPPASPAEDHKTAGEPKKKLSKGQRRRANKAAKKAAAAAAEKTSAPAEHHHANNAAPAKH